MKAYTHIIWALILVYYFLHPTGLKDMIAYTVLAVFFSILCDIDHPDSKVGRFFKPIGWLFRHRGFFHSLFFLAIVIFFLEVSGQHWVTWIAFIGIFSHMLLDALTKQGIQPLYPLPWRVCGPTKSGGVFDFILTIVGLVVLVWMFV